MYATSRLTLGLVMQHHDSYIIHTIWNSYKVDEERCELPDGERRIIVEIADLLRVAHGNEIITNQLKAHLLIGGWNVFYATRYPTHCLHPSNSIQHLQITNYKLQITNYKLQITNSSLKTSNGFKLFSISLNENSSSCISFYWRDCPQQKYSKLFSLFLFILF